MTIDNDEDDFNAARLETAKKTHFYRKCENISCEAVIRVLLNPWMITIILIKKYSYLIPQHTIGPL